MHPADTRKIKRRLALLRTQTAPVPYAQQARYDALILWPAVPLDQLSVALADRIEHMLQPHNIHNPDSPASASAGAASGASGASGDPGPGSCGIGLIDEMRMLDARTGWIAGKHEWGIHQSIGLAEFVDVLRLPLPTDHPRFLQAVRTLVACRLSLVACRLSLVACRLSLVACRLSLVACRLSLVACRLSLLASLIERAASISQRSDACITRPLCKAASEVGQANTAALR